MYKIQNTPDDQAIMRNDSIVTPLLTLKDEYGGVSHIIEDDHCYVLINGNSNMGFGMAYHWYTEAVDAVQTLPGPKPA